MKPKLYRAGNFIHILPAGTRGADIVKLQFALVQLYRRTHLNHKQSIATKASLSPTTFTVSASVFSFDDGTGEQHGRKLTHLDPLAQTCPYQHCLFHPQAKRKCIRKPISMRQLAKRTGQRNPSILILFPPGMDDGFVQKFSPPSSILRNS